MVMVKERFDVDESNSIGRGTFGVVFKGKKKPTKAHPEVFDVAVKYLINIDIKSSDGQKDFYRELLCQSSLNHIGVLPLINYQIPMSNSTEGDCIMFVTPFMKNGSLHDVLKIERKSLVSGGRSDWNGTTRAINAFGIAAAMAYVHQNNVIHRDLKSANILLDDNMYPKICDFGLSRMVDKENAEQAQKTMGVGSPVYMAPEIIDGDGSYDEKVDVYAYSMVLYELFTCEEPYYDVKFSLIKYMQGYMRPKLEKGRVPPIFYDLIQKCWDSSPHNRPSFKQIVKHMYDDVSGFFETDFMEEVDIPKLMDYMEEAIKGLNLDEE